MKAKFPRKHLENATLMSSGVGSGPHCSTVSSDRDIWVRHTNPAMIIQEIQSFIVPVSLPPTPRFCDSLHTNQEDTDIYWAACAGIFPHVIYVILSQLHVPHFTNEKLKPREVL